MKRSWLLILLGLIMLAAGATVDSLTFRQPQSAPVRYEVSVPAEPAAPAGPRPSTRGIIGSEVRRGDRNLSEAIGTPGDGRLEVARNATEEAQLYQRIVSQLQSARYAFNHPDTMLLGRRSQITLALASDAADAIATLKGQFERQVEGSVKSGAVQFAPMMIATLRGKDFKIDPSGPQEKMAMLTVKGPTEWTWFVEPLDTGAGKLLVLELAARVRAGDNLAPITIKTFEARVKVDVRPLDRVIAHARQMTPISQALTGIGGLIAMFGFAGTVRRWLKGGTPAA